MSPSFAICGRGLASWSGVLSLMKIERIVGTMHGIFLLRLILTKILIAWASCLVFQTCESAL